MPRAKKTIQETTLFPYNTEPQDPMAQASKEEYRRRLAEYLKDPAFRAIEGFPIGTDEDILALSDPPYYTACPNPFLPEILEQWEKERAETRKALGLPDDSQMRYHREPFAADVSEGKNDPIYNAHSYHTKVPHKAIMRYILHYTDPGDIVFDGFCGTGMTGVAAQLCGDKTAVEELGYTVKPDGKILDETGKTISRLGARKSILNDLSPAATFISYNYNTPVDLMSFERDAKQILKSEEKDYGWMFETWHPDCDSTSRVKGHINFTVWSEVFACPHCGSELVYFDIAVDQESFAVKDTLYCSKCNTQLNKKDLDRVWISYFDPHLQRPHNLVKYKPVLISYQIGKERFEKKPDNEDLYLIEKIEQSPIDAWYPSSVMLDGERKNKDGYILKGITHLHHFYFRRSLISYSQLWSKTEKLKKSQAQRFVKFYVQGSCLGYTKMNRYSANHFSQVNRYFSGTLFVGSLISEVSPSYSMSHKLDRLTKLHMPGLNGATFITCQTSTNLPSFANDSIDYIFIDPPFGNNLNYSELNYFWESWLRLLTAREPEAVMDKGRDRTIDEYGSLMLAAFQELYRVIRPGRWITVEFHNSQNSVWNAIQLSLQQAGFVVADVRTLDKQQETYKQSIQNLVKQDLIITAYKPERKIDELFHLKEASVNGVWEFIRYHLDQLPQPDIKNGLIRPQTERFPYLLFDRTVAFHLVHGLTVPISASDFYPGLAAHFLIRDGMYFTPSQAVEYDHLRLKAERVEQLALFVIDEQSAIQWLRQELSDLGHGPETYSDLQPRFLQQLHQEKYEKLPELREILEQNFLRDEQERWYVPDPDRQSDLEALRQNALLREFSEYLRGRGRLRVFRGEAVRAGFSQAWRERRYEVIVELAERLPEQALQEDPKLKMYYDNALGRAEKRPRQERLI